MPLEVAQAHDELRPLDIRQPLRDILLQYKPAPDGPLEHCTEHILQRVQWAESSDNAQMVPSRTEFATVGVPGTPAELANWLRGGFMSGDL